MTKKALKIFPLIAIAIVLAICGGCGDNSENGDSNGSGGAAVADVSPETEIVRIGENALTEGQLQEYMAIMAHNAGNKPEDYSGAELDEFRESSIESFITNTVVRDYMESLGVGVMTQEIAMAAEQIGAILRTDQALLKAVEDNGVSSDIFEKYVAFVQYMDWFYSDVKAGLDLSEEVIAEYYETNRDDLKRTYVGASHIVVGNLELAEEILEKLKDGEDFGELVIEFSMDEATREDGGALPHFGRNETIKEFEDVVFSLEIGELSGPVRTMYGYHIIRLDERYQEEMEFDVVASFIEDVLVREACNEKIWELRRDTRIEYLD